MNTRIQWIKSTLQNNYVGAIIVAMLAVYGVNLLVAMIMTPVKVAVTASLLRPASVLGQFRSEQPEYPQTSFYVGEVIHAVLLLGLAVLIAYWIYAPETPEALEGDVGGAEETA